MNLPLISIITPTFNASKTLSACIESVATQNYPNFEHWIIDGLSEDSTMEIVKEYAQKYPHIKYISEKDTGIYHAMNKGIKFSNGEWLYFLGADDCFYDKEVLKSVFDAHYIINTDFIYGKIYNVNWQKATDYQEVKMDNLFFIENTICHQAIFIRKRCFEQIGFFDENLKICADKKWNYDYFNDSSNIKSSYAPFTIANYAGTGISVKTNYPEISYVIKHILKSLPAKDYSFAQSHVMQLVDVWLSHILFYGNSLSLISKAIQNMDKEVWGKVVRQRFFKVSFWLARSSDSGAFTNLHKGNIIIGLTQVLFLIVKEKKPFYYLKNSLYWLKRRLMK